MQCKKREKKQPLTYAITPVFSDEIKAYVDSIHKETGLPKNRIVSNILFEAVRNAKKIYPKISESSVL